MRIKLSLLFISFLFLNVHVFAACNASFDMDIDSQGDTVCAGVAINFTNTSVLNGGEPIAGSLWVFGDGQPDGNGETTTHAYIQAGTYTIRLNTSSITCTGAQVSRTITVIDPPTVAVISLTHPLCHAVCDGAIDLSINGAHSNYHILWDDGQDIEDPIGLCDGSYSVSLSDNYGCFITSPTYTIVQPPLLMADAGDDITICIGDSPIQMQGSATGGTGSYLYFWEPSLTAGLDDPTEDAPTLTPEESSFTTFFFTVTDDNGCMSVDQVEVIKTPANIVGIVSDEDGNFMTGGGKAYLILSTMSGHEWMYLDTVTINPADGTYYFPEVPPGQDVIILVSPNGAMPTFYGDTVFWEGAIPILPACGQSYSKDIQCGDIPVDTGDCSFSGNVYKELTGKTLTDDPIPFIDIVVKKTPPGNAIAYTQTTNPSGGFTFTSMGITVPTDTFSFVVNIPGLPMVENYKIQVTAQDLAFNNLDFYVRIDTVTGEGGIYTHSITGVEVIKRSRETMTVFPNPFSSNCELQFPNKENGTFAFTLFDVTGKIISHATELTGNNYLLKTEALAKGIYIAEIQTGDNVYRNRVMKE